MAEVKPFSETVKNGDWTCATCGGDLGAMMAWDGPEVSIPAGCPTARACALKTLKLFESMFTEKVKGIC